MVQLSDGHAHKTMINHHYRDTKMSLIKWKNAFDKRRGGQLSTIVICDVICYQSLRC